MQKIIGVRFRTAGKVYFFNPKELFIKKGDHVIVETARGLEYGTVVSGVQEMEDEKIAQPLKPVLRVATAYDERQQADNVEKEKEAFQICLEKIRKHGLKMKLIDTEYTFDNNKILFYFTADGRIDFRELVKDLAAVFKTRIELRQIGVRDETKILGGIGICGRPLCCHTFLSEFAPVSIKMAKEQNLSLNPTKISGVCGRLMCCLKNEEETYEDLNKRLPGVGDYVSTNDGLRGEVHSVNVLRQLVKVIVDMGDEKEIKEYHAQDLQFKKMFHKDRSDLTEEEMEQLALLEKQEQEDKMLKEERKSEKMKTDNPRRENREKPVRPEPDEKNHKTGRNDNRDGNFGKRYEKKPRQENGNYVPKGKMDVHTEKLGNQDIGQRKPRHKNRNRGNRKRTQE